jgi:hypothetical protein
MEDKSRQIDSNSIEGGYFEIRVQGHLDSSWSDWLEGLDMKLVENGDMILSGYIPDQAALIGILNKLSRLNLALRSVNQRKENNHLEEK